ncbi:hypothetical protein ACFWCA_18055 [Streptomyces phaeochromogenes]|uniref:hypothetical protein n=1 Tax=Streptomyces phaeochromogenes TaxID=1923 RepID=UPI002E29AA51|nr:hypothetical protein [Streptomyces phaeochromogenes]
MAAVVTRIDLVSPDNKLKCSMHDSKSPNCSGPVVAVAMFDDLGGTDNHWNVCQWWVDNSPLAIACRENQ